MGSNTTQDMSKNILHGSDSVESAEKEIALWFSPDEVISWNKTEDVHLYE